MTTRRLDMLGAVCPVPLMRTQETYATLAPGEDLIVETDFARSVRNITHWCGRQGIPCELLETDDDGLWRIHIRKL